MTKIFLLAPLAALVVLLPTGRIWRRALLALFPVAATYGASLLVVTLRGTTLPLLAFTPPSKFGVNAWTFANLHWHLSDQSAKHASTPLTILGVAALIVVIDHWQPIMDDIRTAARIFAALLLVAFLLFYVIEPEYYVYLLPPVALLVRRGRELAPLAFLFGAPWVVNFASGVEYAEHGARVGGRGAFIHLAHDLHVPLAALSETALCVATLTSLVAAVALIRRIRLTSRPAALD